MHGKNDHGRFQPGYQPPSCPFVDGISPAISSWIVMALRKARAKPLKQLSAI